MDLCSIEFRFPKKVIDEKAPTKSLDHLFEDLFGEIHIVVYHRIAETDGGVQLPIESFIDNAAFVKERHSIPPASGNDGTVVVFENPTRLSDGVFDENLHRTAGRPPFKQRKLTLSGQLFEKFPLQTCGLLATVQVIVKIHLSLL